MKIIKYKKIFLSISLVLVLASFLSIGLFGLKFGIDFTGGSILEVSYSDGRPEVAEVNSVLNELGLGSVSLRVAGENSYIIRTKFLEDKDRVSIISALSFDNQKNVIEERFNSVGPTVGSELKRKAYVAIVIVILAIILFIAFAFRHVSKPVSSWKYGLVAIVALIHDITIPTGVFALLGKFAGLELDVLFVMALLAILGYSVNDTIVVFDRVRENLRHNQEVRSKESFSDTVGKSLDQTYARSFNVSITIFIVLLSLFLFGGASTTYFALAMMIGVAAGTYSSLFIASPLLVILGDRIK